jgi:DNA-binding LacI/PurR family transcriptional regulator
MITNRLIGFVVARATTTAYPELLPELLARLEVGGFQAVLFLIDHEGDADAALERARRFGLAGFICAALPSESQMAALRAEGVPLLLYNCHARKPTVDSVSCDHAACGRALAELLLEGGHRRFGVIASPGDSLVGVERVAGVEAALRAGRALAAEVEAGDYTYESGAEALDALFARMRPRPSAVIAANDAMALGAIDRARALQVRMPRDLSVVGIDGALMGQLPSYGLTTIRQPLAQMAQSAVSLLTARIARPDGPAEIRLFGGELIPGRTVRLQPRGRPPQA